MATVSLYNHTRRRCMDGSNAAGDTYKLILCTALTFNATHTTLAGITYTEVTNGNGYTTGGATLQNVTIATTNTDEALFDADDVSWTAGSSALAASHALLVNITDSGSPPVLAIDFGGSQSTPAGAPFAVAWNNGGIIAGRKPAS